LFVSDHKGVDGRNVTVGPPSGIAGDLIGAFDGTPISFDLVNGELRDSTGRDYGLALVGPSGGPYDLVGLASPATATVPEGNVKIYDQWNLDFYLGYAAEQGWFYFIPTTEADNIADELLKIVFADRSKPFEQVSYITTPSY
jgi:hypothetical protein